MGSTKGVVAAGDPQTAEAGAALLREGGNAVDAAVAAAFAAFVCELPLCSPLGGGVCVVERGNGEAIAFDMFARTPGLGLAPGSPRDFAAVTVNFGAAAQVFHVGAASVAVPLALSGLIELQRRLGARPLAAVLAPATALAKDGYVLGTGCGFVFDILRPIIDLTPEGRALFSGADGEIAGVGAHLRNPDMAQTLADIAARPARVRELYRALADELGPRHGGLITPEDVDHAALAEHAPIAVAHGDWHLATMPFPSTGGLLVALGLRLLEGVGRYRWLSKEHELFVGKVQEALLSERDDTFRDRVADPVLARAMLEDERLKVARAKARSLLGSTTQISAIDEEGNAVSLTLTNGEGSGHVLRGTGMMANNILGEEDLHPRGFHEDAPGTAINTMMAPAILSRGADRVALGSGGSNRLRTAILQTIVGLVEHGVSPAEAVHAPRLHVEIDRASGEPKLAFEAAGMAPDVVQALKDAYPFAPAVFEAPNLYFGGVHCALRIDGSFEGVGDARRGGARVIV
ncbi:MAG: gamma-glutamyltransferase [Labilithrix sp.]|nr:gamma-glutamyltransferase [Labilithrix sp.]MCW5814460.1 gamma-glutamyltransferase [Labilithrix sp.]